MTAAILSIATDEEFVAALNSTDLSNAVVVVDMHARFAGPCEAIDALFKRLRMDYGSDALVYLRAITDNITYLSCHRDRSCPAFSIWIRGVLLASVLGANAPMLESLVQRLVPLRNAPDSQLPGLINTGGMNLPLIVRPGLAFEPGSMQQAAFEPEYPARDFVAVFIKPISSYSEVCTMIQAAGFTIVYQRRVWMSSSQLSALFSISQPVEAFVSSPFHVLFIAPQQVNEDTIACIMAASLPNRDINVLEKLADAKEAYKIIEKLEQINQPEQIEGEYCLTFICNGIKQQVIDEIVSRILARGFTIYRRATHQLTCETLSQVVEEQVSRENPQVNAWIDAPSEAILIKGEYVTSYWHEMLGDDRNRGIRGIIGLNAIGAGVIATKSNESCLKIKAIVFGSSTSNLAAKPPIIDEIQRTLALVKPDLYAQAAEILDGPIKTAGFKVILKKTMTMTAEIATEFYAEHREKTFYSELIRFMTSGPIIALVLEQTNAISNWRHLIGPENIETAKNTAPESLRAKYGTKNGFHGSESVECANREIQIIFQSINGEQNADQSGLALKEDKKQRAKSAVIGKKQETHGKKTLRSAPVAGQKAIKTSATRKLE